MNSTDVAINYLTYHEYGDSLVDTTFVNYGDYIRIDQPIDDEEGDVFFINRNEIDPVLWDEFVQTFCSSGS